MRLSRFHVLLSVASVGSALAQAPPIDGTIRCGEQALVSNVDKPNYVGQISGDVLLLWNFTEGGDWSVSTCSENTDFDTFLSLYEERDPELTNLLEQNDDAECGSGLGSSTMSGSSHAGVYYVVVEGFANSVGQAEVSITCGAHEVDL